MMTSSVSLIVDIEDNLCERHFEKFILTMNATVGNKMIAGAATPFVKEASIALLFFSIWCFETFTENVLKTSPLLGAICAGVIVGPVLQVAPYPEAFAFLGKIGVMLLVLESSLEVKIEQVKIILVSFFHFMDSYLAC